MRIEKMRLPYGVFSSHVKIIFKKIGKILVSIKYLL